MLPESPQSKSAISVGPVSPPIPAKIAEKIWRGEYIELQELLPACLGALGPTILDALLQPDKMKQKKTIITIQEWIVCFNTFISVVAMRNPNQVRDLLTYSSTIVKASQEFGGIPWLEYNIYFRRQIATQAKQQWEMIDASLWTMYFARATPRSGPISTNGERKNPIQDKRQQTYQNNRYNPRVCFRFNSHGGCYLTNCKFLHCCIRCRETSHTAIKCPRKPNPAHQHLAPWTNHPRRPMFVPLWGDDKTIQYKKFSHSTTHHPPTNSCCISTTQKSNHTLSNSSELDADNIEFDPKLASYTIYNHNHPSMSNYPYPYTADLLQLNYCTEINPEILPPHALKITTPFIASQWEAPLVNHPDRHLVRYLLIGITEGFRIGFQRGHKCRRASSNMRSAITYP